MQHIIKLYIYKLVYNTIESLRYLTNTLPLQAQFTALNEQASSSNEVELTKEALVFIFMFNC